MTHRSLRVRLVAIILGPLLLIAAALGAWELHQSRITASALFDRSLLATAFAISRDVAYSGGDALAPDTRDLIADTSGGPVFYHVFAPDGVFVTGYATPPVVPRAVRTGGAEPLFFEARYQGANVRVVRLREATEIDGLSGIFTVTVWQDVAVRRALVAEIGRRVIAVIAILVTTVAVVVWFGVGAGLRPLRSLEAAISERGPDDLRPIRRQVPVEVAGIVATLNALLIRLGAAMETQRSFVSNAAHQLRNPLAGLLAMAEAVRGAEDKPDRAEREAALVDAARSAADLANKLLLLERASAAVPNATRETFDLDEVASGIADDFRPLAAGRGVRLVSRPATDALDVSGDPTMVREAIRNLVANAFAHGGEGVSEVAVEARDEGRWATVLVRDDGRGLAPADWPAALERFGQARPGPGSGLGLSIAHTVAEALGGALALRPTPAGTCVAFSVPRVRPQQRGAV